MNEIELLKTMPTNGNEVWAIAGCTNHMLMTIHEALANQRELILRHIKEAHVCSGNTYENIFHGTRGPDSLFAKMINQGNLEYDCSEDMLFLAEELRKVSELMFRIKTEKGVF